MSILRFTVGGLLVGALFLSSLVSGVATAQPTLRLGTVIRPAAGAGALGQQFYMSVKGAKQGQLKGDGTSAQWRDWMACLGFEYEVSSPRDAATGQATGRRLHKPVTITKEWGAASPQLFQACVTNEVLPQVVINFVTTAADGRELPSYSITLQNATISQVRMFTPVPNGPWSPRAAPLEQISFTFQKITVESALGQTIATDDWAY